MSRHSKREEEERDILGELGGWLVYILLIIGLTYLIITFVGQRTMVSGSSMETTLQDGDNLIVDKISYRFRDPKRYDIIVFPYKYEEDTYYIKRIIGMPGGINMKKIHIISNVSSECRVRLCRSGTDMCISMENA